MLDIYPIEKLIELKNNPNFMGRLVVHKIKDQFHVEVDVVTVESQKIFTHIGTFYGFSDSRDALESGFVKFVESVGLKSLD